MIEVYDDTVPFHVQQNVYNSILNSFFRIKGWDDRDDPDITKHDLHSQWSIEDLKNSKLYPFIEKINPFNTWQNCIINLTKSGDHYYTHTHGDDTNVVLYYANLEWRDEWAGETMFYDNKRIPTNAFAYTPGRIIKFDGTLPHSIRPQSSIGPQFRFTITNFFKKNV